MENKQSNSIQEINLSIKLFVNPFYVTPGLNMQTNKQTNKKPLIEENLYPVGAFI